MRTVVVSGTSSGIGAAVADAFLQRGYRVIGLSRRGNPGLSKRPKFIDRRADLRDHEAVRGALEGIGTRVCATVLNAGVSPEVQPLTDVDWPALAGTYESNVQTALNLLQCVVPLLQSNGGGTLTFVGSSLANGYSPERWPYAAAKAALTTLMRACSTEFAKDKIVANEVRPGPVATPMTVGGIDNGADERVLRLLNDGYGTDWLKSAKTVAAWIVSIAEFPANGPNGQIFNYSRNVT